VIAPIEDAPFLLCKGLRHDWGFSNALCYIKDFFAAANIFTIDAAISLYFVTSSLKYACGDSISVQ
jgi:hypothetical protein